jgi:hypothetical protein
VVLNKVLPSYFLDDDATRSAQAMCTDGDKLAAQLPDSLGAPEAVGRVLREVGESFLNYRVVATREAEQQKELAHRPDIVATAPYFDQDIYDLGGLLALGERIWR